ncbi:hypothetical protein [Chitinophaga sp. sic0106]|uniref:hypothetical protein n=1 Tax=Chitinophaga sp. sic0106 TaxID=2854785 RepID=UPI001C43A95D|nr:hypothetical protein [Chitinophaga sp. sic0106]MBV7530143.1 hypothetical protein [Chitinophaga sp. sic0106]
MKKGLLLYILISAQLLAIGQANKADTQAPKTDTAAPKAKGQATAPTGGLLIRPATIEFRLANGQTSVGKVIITNKLPVKKQFTIYINDFDRDTVGAHIYSPAGSTHHSCAKWVTMDKTFVEVEPGETIEVPVKIAAPLDTAAIGEMKWAMLFFETTQEQVVEDAKGMKTKVHNRMRVGIHLYQTPPAFTERDVQILDFKLPTDSARTCNLVCENTGKMQIEVNSYLELSNTSTNERTKVDFPQFPMFPGQKRVLSFQIPQTLPKGKYSIIGVVDAGSDIPLAAVQENVEF